MTDLTGKRFEKWEVLSFSRRTDKNKYYNCRCECGTEREVSAYKLIKGLSKSCGCSRIKDMTGKKHKMITFVEKVGYNKNKKILYKCQCDCGNIIFKSKSDVMKINSCGCSNKEKAIKSIELNSKKLKRVDGTCIDSLTQKLSKNNTSGHKGVSWDKKSNKWRAQIMLKGKTYNLGCYEDINDAIVARENAEKELYSDYINLNKEES